MSVIYRQYQSQKKLWIEKAGLRTWVRKCNTWWIASASKRTAWQSVKKSMKQPNFLLGVCSCSSCSPVFAPFGEINMWSKQWPGLELSSLLPHPTDVSEAPLSIASGIFSLNFLVNWFCKLLSVKNLQNLFDQRGHWAKRNALLKMTMAFLSYYTFVFTLLVAL